MEVGKFCVGVSKEWEEYNGVGDGIGGDDAVGVLLEDGEEDVVWCCVDRSADGDVFVCGGECGQGVVVFCG